MPTYVYRCKKCKHLFELFHRITDDTVKRCPRCRAKAERVPAGGTGILFKGSGFYVTDYRSKSYRDKAKQEKPGGSSGSTPAGSPGTSPGPAGGSAGSGGSSGGSGGSAGSAGGSAGSGGSSGASGGSAGRPRDAT